MSHDHEHDHQAVLWEKLDGQKVACRLCGHRCVIAAGNYGLCRVRRNVDGVLRTLTYDAVVAMNVDPIEKKPLYHFLPGTKSLSIAAPGCNFQCEFCQNWQISQLPREGKMAGKAVSPAQIVSAAKNYNCRSISYTYTEPTVFFELAYDTSVLSHEQGLKNAFVSNGFMTPQAVEKISPVLDAINVDLKAFRDQTYRRVMKARLDPVLECLEALVAAGVWVEVTTLVVPGMNDSPEELSDIADYIAGKLGVKVPWHVSRFHGDYRMTAIGPTPPQTMDLACRLGRQAGLEFVYCGNVSGSPEQSTLCPRCRQMLVERDGFSVSSNRLDDGKCPGCGEPIPGIWQ